MKMKLVNLTPHEIVLLPSSGGELRLPPSGIVARCAVVRDIDDVIRIDRVEVPVNRTTFGEVTGLPDPEPGTCYVVSALVAQAVKRADIFAVDDAVRDGQGRIVGARALARI